MAISFVGSTSWLDFPGGVEYTVLKPSGVQQGDLMIAILSYEPASSFERSVSPPSGWTFVRSEWATGGGGAHQHAVIYRVASSSEPGSWNGSFSSTMRGGLVCCAAYRGATGIKPDHTGDGVGRITSYGTGSVNNDSSANWRFTSAGYTSGSVNYVLESSEAVNRISATEVYSNDQDIEAGIWDSGATVDTGNHSRVISRDAAWSASACFIGILEADDEAIPGDLEVELPLPSVIFPGDISHGAELEVELPLLAMTSAGIATPPEGVLDTTITPVVEVSGHNEASGVLAPVITPVVNISGETRSFGVRVIVISSEDRVTKPTRKLTDSTDREGISPLSE